MDKTKAFLEKFYFLIFGILLITIVISTFYVGMIEGKKEAGENVQLICKDEVLKQLAIPLDAFDSSSNTSTTQKTMSLNIVSDNMSDQGRYAGSKNGTKYYTPGCAGLKRIKPENLIWFSSEEDAKLQGYTQAKC